MLKQHQEPAFNYLYDHYSASLYSVILNIVPDKELANDVLQEVFLKIWRQIDTYDTTKGRLFTWMLNVARNASIDIIRSKNFQNSKFGLYAIIIVEVLYLRKTYDYSFFSIKKQVVGRLPQLAVSLPAFDLQLSFLSSSLHHKDLYLPTQVY